MAKYLIRMDDACPQMHLKNWNRVEEILDKYSIKPIVAVIPDNKDETLNYGFDNSFWTETINRWKNKDWHLALHGYQHLYHETSQKSLIPLKSKSEFTGDSYEVQKSKILKGIEILNKYSIFPTTFIAPGHAFDEITLDVLYNETNIKYISDGLSFRPFIIRNITWIPQQIWQFRKMPFGIWTICLHPNTMNEKDFKKMEECLERISKDVLSWTELVSFKAKKSSIFDSFFHLIFLQILKYK
jgi:predicted deacetylase